MSIPNDALIIGLTGSFGGGCSILRAVLEEMGFDGISLSTPVHERWQELHPGQQLYSALRGELQDIGNEFRQQHDYAFLAKKAWEKLDSMDGVRERIVIDSIRHPDEVAFFRGRYPRFFLVDVYSTLEERWERLKDQYTKKGLSIRDFQEEDNRDACEDIIDYGQKVQLCVDDSDIAILNEKHLEPVRAQKDSLQNMIKPYINLITGSDPWSPTEDESMMALAYTKALSSSCYKRQVGAVIVDEKGTVLGAGCNQNPLPLDSCLVEFGECYRDMYKRHLLADLQYAQCPGCHEELKDNITDDHRCKKCNFDLEKHYIRDKVLGHCTALHAEESAILHVGGQNLTGSTMYTTTFPCFLCALKIVASGITRVVYCEPYADPGTALVFQKVNARGQAYAIQLNRFQGVKARVYYKLFSSWRIETEKNLKKRKG